MKEINREIKKKFSDKTQMIILVYDDFDSDFDNSNPEVQNLKQEGIKIVKLSDITDIDVQSLEYRRSETDDHPNNKAWHVIAPALAEKLNLK